MITDRQKQLLFTVVNEYVKGAEPVSSQHIHEKYDFGLSSATLRNEFAALEEGGYVQQPHTSAGRVPTDKGYRLFVDALLEQRNREKKQMKDLFERLRRYHEESNLLFAEMARMIASLSGSAAFSGLSGSRAFFKSGIREALSQPELEDASQRKHFGDVVDSFDESFDELTGALEKEGPSVFIGRENPIPHARDFSMMISRCRLPEGNGVVVIFGPKRMDYRKNLRLLDTLEDFLNKQ